MSSCAHYKFSTAYFLQPGQHVQGTWDGHWRIQKTRSWVPDWLGQARQVSFVYVEDGTQWIANYSVQWTLSKLNKYTQQLLFYPLFHATGVLLLNACLTVTAHKANSHQGQGWEKITDAVIRWLNDNTEGLVFLLWGSFAQKKAAFVDKVGWLYLLCDYIEILSHEYDNQCFSMDFLCK